MGPIFLHPERHDPADQLEGKWFGVGKQQRALWANVWRHFVLEGVERRGRIEMIYADGAAAICRCFNWREVDRTKPTSATTDALLVIETLGEHESGRLEAALGELGSLIAEQLGGQKRSLVVDRANPTAALDR